MTLPPDALAARRRPARQAAPRAASCAALLALGLLLAGPALAAAAQPPQSAEPPAEPAPAAPGDPAVATAPPPATAQAAAAPATQLDEDSLLPVPQPALAGLDPAVAEQLQEMAQRVEAIRHSIEDIGPASEAPRMPEDPAVRARLAEAYGELGLHYHAYSLLAVAEPAYFNAARLAPEEPRWPHLLGLLLIDAGRLDEAAALLGLALALSPGDPALLVHLGEVHRLQGDLPAAERSFAAALAGSPGYPSARAGLGQVALAGGRWQEAADHLAAALAAVPGADLLHYPLAMAYRGLGDRERAESHLARRGVVGLRPPDPQIEALAAVRTGERVHRTRGRQALRVGRVDDAVAAFRRALEANPESAEARVDLAAALAAQDKPLAAIGALREAVAAAPDNPTARYNLGVLLHHQGDLDGALVHLRRAVELAPADGEAWLELAGALLDIGAAGEALAPTRRARELGANEAGAHFAEGRALLALGRVGESIASLEAAHAADPADGQVAHLLARLLAGAPDPALRSGERAVELAERVFAAAPTVAHAETLALALAEAGRCDDAAALQEQAVEGARAGGAEAEAARLGRILAHYREQRPCRAPTAETPPPAGP
jgi:tetratricopeptide (TPR) repeat protein